MKSFRLAAVALSIVVAAPAIAATIPVGYTDTLVATIPTSAGNFYGDVAADASGNLYVTGGLSPNVYKIAANGTVSVFAQGNASNALGVEVVGDDLYFGHANNGLYRKSLSGGAVQALAPPSGQVSGIAAAGDTLYLANASTIRRYDAATNSYLTTATAPGSIKPSVAVATNGRLLITDYSAGVIRSYDPATNSYGVFRSGIATVSGIAVHAGTGDVYAMSESTRQLVRISADGLTQSVFASAFNVDGGSYPQGISFSADYTKLFYLDRNPAGSGFNVRQIAGFEAYAADVAEPAMIALFGLGFLGIAAGRRRRR